jgi:hypothetical protein
VSDAIAERVIRTDIQMQVVARDGQIHMLFSEPDKRGELVPAYTSNFLMSASDALVCSTMLADMAFEVETSLKPMGNTVKAELMNRHRAKLIDRLQVMLNSLRERKTTNNRNLAKQLVDEMMHEVFS